MRELFCMSLYAENDPPGFNQKGFFAAKPSLDMAMLFLPIMWTQSPRPVFLLIQNLPPKDITWKSWSWHIITLEHIWITHHVSSTHPPIHSYTELKRNVLRPTQSLVV